MNRFQIYAFLVLCALLAAPAYCQMTEAERDQADLEKVKRIGEEIKAADTAIDFYGKIVDQNGEAVPDAEVVYHIRHFSALAAPFYMRIKEATVKTDVNGCFDIRGERGHLFSIQSINKPGYEYSHDGNPKLDVEFRPNRPMEGPGSDSSKRATFVLRKRGETTFLAHSVNGRWGIVPGEKRRYHADIVEGRSIRLEPPVEGYQAKVSYFDLEIAGEYVKNDNKYYFKLTPQGEGSGIFVSDRILYEAPKDEEFKKEVTLTAEGGDKGPVQTQTPVFVYLKVRKPPYFVRVDGTLRRYGNAAMDTKPGNEPQCVFMFKSFTNPYGERCLESEPDIPGDADLRLSNEARNAFQKGEYAKKPDIKKLVEEFHAAPKERHSR